MRKLPEVEEAKSLMTEAMAWSVMKWLREKKRVRKVADKANAALDELNRTAKARWSHELRAAYDELTQQPGTHPSPAINPDLRQFARQVKEADEQAYRARMDAERTFDEAERLLSTRLAREGCQKAILSWDLHEKAIRHAEA
jgi:hypothetical protein